MKICHVSPHLPPDQAANALLPAQLGGWMAERGDDVVFVAHEAGQRRLLATGYRPPEDLSVLQPAAGSRQPATRWIPRRGDRGWRRALMMGAWQLVRRVNAALDDVAAHADVLHLHSNGLIIEAAAAWARRRRTPYVLTLYGTEIWHYRRRWPIDPFTRAYAGASRVTFYSQGLLARAQELRLDRPGLSVIYPPVAETFAPRSDASRTDSRRKLGIADRLLVLNVKRLHPLAGQRFLLDAFARVCAMRPDVRLVICGEGEARGALTAQAAALGIASRVTLTGLLPNAAIADYMAAADVFALPSLLEALPTVAVEALASGTPVVSADHPGGVELHGIFDDDVAVVPRENADALAAALDRSLAAPRRTTAATAARLDRLFRPPAVIDAFNAVYAEARQARA